MKRDTWVIYGLGVPVVAQAGNHVIFLAKTMKYNPILPCRGLNRDTGVPVTPAFAG